MLPPSLLNPTGLSHWLLITTTFNHSHSFLDLHFFCCKSYQNAKIALPSLHHLHLHSTNLALTPLNIFATQSPLHFTFAHHHYHYFLILSINFFPFFVYVCPLHMTWSNNVYSGRTLYG